MQEDCRSALDGMLGAQGILESELQAKKSGKATNAEVHADSTIKFGMLTKSSDLLGTGGDIFELGLSQALGTAKKVIKGLKVTVTCEGLKS